MPPGSRVRQVVLLRDEVVYTRHVRRNAAPPSYAPLLQDVLLEEGEVALRKVALQWYHGFVREVKR